MTIKQWQNFKAALFSLVQCI